MSSVHYPDAQFLSGHVDRRDVTSAKREEKLDPVCLERLRYQLTSCTLAVCVCLQGQRLKFMSCGPLVMKNSKYIKIYCFGRLKGIA